MRSPNERRRDGGLTWVEALIAVVVIAVLLALVMPIGLLLHRKMQMAVTMHNMTSLYLVTQQMALDGSTVGGARAGWPGDTGGSFTNWVAGCVPSYYTTNDFCGVVSGPGKIVPSGHLPTMAECAVLVYAVGANSPSNVVFLSTANFSNTPSGGILNENALPYGGSEFVVMKRNGEARRLSAGEAGNTNQVGAFAPPLR